MKKIVTVMSIICALMLSSCATQPKQEQSLIHNLQGKVLTAQGVPVVLDSEYYLVYYAANWCPYCTEFTEELRGTYDRIRRMYGNVQIVFAGHVRDISDADMVDYLAKGNFDFGYVPMAYREATGIMQLVDVPKFYIPGFVLVDANGNVLSSSNGNTKESYDCRRPLQYYESLQMCDCLTSQ